MYLGFKGVSYFISFKLYIFNNYSPKAKLILFNNIN